jgi:hypothetical protein
MKPVAWTACLSCGQRVTGDSIHTCSPQLKTLTDEEIAEIIQHLENAKYVGASKAATMLRQQQAEIKNLKQQVAFLEDWRDTWLPTIKQLMNINVKVNEK